MTDADVLALRALARELAEEAAALILAGPRQIRVEATKSSPTDVVTAMDRAVEELLRGRIRAARPQDAVLGEEGGLDAADSPLPDADRLTWVLDPIDGTVNYLYGSPVYAVSVAVVSGDPRVPGRWTPIAGCVLQPVEGRAWTAARGHGAEVDGRRLRLGPPPPLAQALVGTGFGYRAARRAGQARVLGGLLPRVRDIRRAGSSSLDVCGVADGRLDAYYERGAHVWDVAAASLVLSEAGGQLTGLGGLPASAEMTVAAGPPLLAELSGLLEELDAATDPPDPSE